MRRLCSQSPRPYLGRSAPTATPLSQQRSGSTASGNTARVGAEVSSGHSSETSGKANEALHPDTGVGVQSRKAEQTDRPSRNDAARRPKLKVAGTAAERSRQALKPKGGATMRHDS